MSFSRMQKVTRGWSSSLEVEMSPGKRDKGKKEQRKKPKKKDGSKKK